MNENKYDEDIFFEKYSQMDRSVKGLQGAGEWYAFKRLLPELNGKKILDLGCGYGWHCRYAAEHGAQEVLGIDLSRKMLEEATKRNLCAGIHYQCCSIEDFEYPCSEFDLVMSSLAFHYVPSFFTICKNVAQCLKPGGEFVFSVEHPVFTAFGNQDWYRDKSGNKLHWPVDRYFEEGARDAVFLGEHIRKFHRTFTTYLTCLLQNGFAVTGVIEPEPDPNLLDTIPDMRDELRRPMMLLISAQKR